MLYIAPGRVSFLTSWSFFFSLLPCVWPTLTYSNFCKFTVGASGPTSSSSFIRLNLVTPHSSHYLFEQLNKWLSCPSGLAHSVCLTESSKYPKIEKMNAFSFCNQDLLSEFHAGLKQHACFDLESTATSNFVLAPWSNDKERLTSLKAPLLHLTSQYFVLNSKYTSVFVFSNICVRWLTYVLTVRRFRNISFLLPVALEIPGLHQKS